MTYPTDVAAVAYHYNEVRAECATWQEGMEHARDGYYVLAVNPSGSMTTAWAQERYDQARDERQERLGHDSVSPIPTGV